MSALQSFLAERNAELENHFALAIALETQLLEGESVSLGQTALSARHLMTVKSGLIVHLYNVVEATMTKVMEDVANAVRSASPNEWSHDALREWLRFSAAIGADGNEDSRLDIIHRAALQLLAHNPIEKLSFKKPSGTWDDKVICTFARRLHVNFPLNPSIGPKIADKPKYGDESVMVFLAKRRNAIAHGRRSFENGANDLPISEIREIADVTFEYLELAVDAFQKYIDEHKYRAAEV